MTLSKHIAAAIAALLFLAAPAYSQCTGQFAPGQTCANPTGSQAPPRGVSESAYFDFLFGATAGSIAYRGPSGWTGLAGNVSGTQVLTENASGVPSWQPAAGTGTVTSVGLALPGIFTVSGSPVTTSGTLTGTLASQTANLFFGAPNGSSGTPTFRAFLLADLPGIGTNTVLGNATSGTAVPAAQSMPSCGAATSALTWTTNTGFGCNTITSPLPTINADNVLGNPTASPAVPIGMALASCSAAQNALTYNTSTHAFGCNTISGSGTVVAGTGGQLTYYPGSTNVVSGNANANISNGALTLGVAGTTIGQLILAGNTSGSATITPQAAAGTPTLTIGTASGTIVTTAASPLAVSATTGQVSITGVAGQVLGGSGPAFTATPTLGAASTATGQVKFAGTTSGTVTFTVADAAGTWTMKLPTSGGTAGQFLSTDGTGVSSWANPSGSGTVNSGTSGQLTYYGATGAVVSGNANANISSGALTLGQASTTQGSLILEGGTSGALTVTTQGTAGTPTWTAGTSSGTPAVTASSPLTITTATGNITCATCVTSSGGGAITGVSPISVSAAGAVSITSVSALVTYIQTQNNTAANLAWYNSSDVSTSGTFGTPLVQVISGGLQNSIVGQAIQNQASASFPAGVTGYGKLLGSGAGNQVFGVFGRADCNVAGGCVNEFDSFNNSASDAPNTFPSANTFGTTSVWPAAVIAAAGGSKLSWAGVYITREGATPNQFLAGVYEDPQAATIYGGLIDADTTHSPQYSWFLKNTGQSSNIHLSMQTTGTEVPTNPIIRHQNAGTVTTFQVLQNGGVFTNTSNSNPAIANNGSFSLWGVADQTNGNTGNSSLQLDTYGTPFLSAIILRTGRGTIAAPTTLSTNDLYGGVAGYPCIGGPPCAYPTQGPVLIALVWTDTGTNQGSAIDIDTSPNGATGNRARAARFQGSGGFSVGTTTDPGIGAILANKSLGSVPTTVSGLPTCNTAAKGQRAFVTDSTSVVFHNTVSGSGSNNVGVTCDGTNWYIS